jgi:hypothetical protein
LAQALPKKLDKIKKNASIKTYTNPVMKQNMIVKEPR